MGRRFIQHRARYMPLTTEMHLGPSLAQAPPPSCHHPAPLRTNRGGSSVSLVRFAQHASPSNLFRFHIAGVLNICRLDRFNLGPSEALHARPVSHHTSARTEASSWSCSSSCCTKPSGSEASGWFFALQQPTIARQLCDARLSDDLGSFLLHARIWRDFS